VHIIRRSPPGDEGPEHGYFVELPRDGRVTVNGRTYINNVPSDHESVALPFIIGPFIRYTIIELLSQPIFFFRTGNDLNFTDTLRKRMDNIISDEEMGQRDPNGNVDVGAFNITWTPLHTPPAAQQPPVDEEPPVEEQPQFAAHTLPERVYDDSWTANGEPIENARGYLQNMLYAPMRDHYREIFSSVLLSINDRQNDLAGFSVNTGEYMLRPGRTFIAPILHPRERHHVLLVFRLNVNMTITLHVLDPMAWQTTAQYRLAIYVNARRMLIESDWWRTSFTSTEDLLPHFPEESIWVDCAQGTDRDELNVFTILNGWALALGLEIVPGFSMEGIEATFFNQAQTIFGLAHRDQLDWRVLYAFLTSHNYARRPAQVPDSEISNEPREAHNELPPENRRFDLRVRSIQQLVTNQRAQDMASRATRRAMDIDLATREAALLLGTGVAHTDLFLVDHMPREGDDNEEIVRDFVLAGVWRVGSTEGEMEHRYMRINFPGHEQSDPPQPNPPDGGESSSSDEDVASSSNDDNENPPEGQDETSTDGQNGDLSEDQNENENSADGGELGNVTNAAATETITVEEQANTKDPPKIPEAQDPTTSAPPPAQALESPKYQTAGNQDKSSEMQPPVRNQAADPKAESANAPSSTQEDFKIPTIDQGDVPDDFNHCAYSRIAMDALAEKKNIPLRNGETVAIGALGFARVFQRIASVARALNELHTAGNGFTVTAPGPRKESSLIPYALPQVHDQVALHVQPFNHRTLLLLIHFETAKSSKNATVYVVDSSPGTNSLDQRQKFYAHLGKEWKKTFDVPIPASLNWTYGPQQPEPWQADYFAILNAWSILLDLRLNTTNFVPSESFFVDANQLLEAATGGDADWKLIWAFLRCTNYVMDQSPPAQGLRFTKTIGSEEIQHHHERLKAKQNLKLTPSKAQNRYMHFTGGPTFRHNEPSPLEIGKKDLTCTQGLKDSGEQKLDLSSGLPEDFRPCAYFRQRRDAILSKPGNRASLAEFRKPREHVTTTFRTWLQDDEVSLAVAAVTLGITQRSQGPESAPLHGFGFTIQPLVQMAMDNRDGGIPVSIRHGCPMLLPVNIEHHFILLIIQMDDQGKAQVSVMVSKAYHLNQSERQQVHDGACRILRNYRWGSNISTKQTLEDRLPTRTMWLPTSQQPTDDECAYYVIMNAWALALGLQPDPNVRIQWTDRFFEELQDIIHLARLGKVNWMMIYAFLRCWKFVHEGIVPEDRRFEETAELRSHQADEVDEIIQEIALNEVLYFSAHPELRPQDLGDANRLQLPPGGRAHDTPVASDIWSNEDRENAFKLARNYKLHLGYDAKQLARAEETSRNDRGRELLDLLRTEGILSQNRDALLAVCRKYLDDWHTGRDLLLAEAPCEVSKDAVYFYDYIFKDATLKKSLRSDAFQIETKLMDQAEVNLSLSAVVEAIDRLQSEQHAGGYSTDAEREKNPFAGGFALSTSIRNELALVGIDEPSITSRPRRCFLMPIFVTPMLVPGLDIPQGRAAGHHMLAAVEEDPSKYYAYVALYDSSADKFKEHHKRIAKLVRRAMPILSWSTHRNVGKRPEQTMDVMIDKIVPEVAQQQGGGWRCGPHTVINGWILAMGLTPSRKADYSNTVMQEFRTLAKAAIAGLLDWRTLVAWFFCRRLTVQRTLESVPENRRFTHTQFWESEAELGRHIDHIYDSDDTKLEQDPSIPYNLGNNVRYLPGDESEDEDDEEEEVDSLKRVFEDPTVQYSKRRVRPYRASRKALVQDALIFLNGYDTPGPGNRAEDRRQQQAPRNKDRVRDDLLFLDGY
jgi:hypothetical protein